MFFFHNKKAYTTAPHCNAILLSREAASVSYPTLVFSLFDTGESKDPPNAKLWAEQVFPVQITSPDARRWSGWRTVSSHAGHFEAQTDGSLRFSS